MVEPFFIGIATGAVALMAALASLILGIKNHALNQRKLSLEEEHRQAEARRLTDKFRNPLVRFFAGRREGRDQCASRGNPRPGRGALRNQLRGGGRGGAGTPGLV
ncbi:hypothetical protein MNEG_14557 [Monoraphidium neglectum]|jgi:hypothetical protein|uniref:Uncharacterized protein n=1 Tax=Monoraphidium neglectum TaxID=145388 RepID=A0A0D2LUV2_9CHLO|nr:hypothetical protein MNEG_14557 [Monoraphidium neglectum]KIY93406.1 hypothetical protein MNEG_14557 [Monoraphidium neglectum]|eukprot:XP_013892426.1 hypothetical protein MNEG_14557 [Monoraphidium neglectum]